MTWLQAVLGACWSRLATDRATAQRGQGMVEYALILVLVAVVVIAALTALGGQISGVFHTITTTITNADH